MDWQRLFSVGGKRSRSKMGVKKEVGKLINANKKLSNAEKS